MIELDSVDHTLELARAELSPSGAAKARARAAIDIVQRPAAATGARALPAAAGFWQALRASGKSGVLAGVILASLSFAAGYSLRTPEPRAEAGTVARIEPQGLALPSPPHVAVEPLPTNPMPDTLPVLEDTRRGPPVAPAARAPRQSRKRAEPVPARPPALGDELALLRRVQRALRASDPSLALAVLDELDERYPDTALVEERQAAAVMAHCGLADPGSRRRAQSFLRDRPQSVYAERVRAACGVERPGARQAGEGSATVGDE
jgi:hypothetical protein